jgi:hypothetical protein
MAALADRSDLEPPELAIALTARLPLNLDDAPQAPSDPAIQLEQLAPLAEAEVASPTTHKRVQVGDYLLQADAAMPPRQFANPVFEPGPGLVGNAPPESRIILDSEAEERLVPRSSDGTLLRVDLQFEVLILHSYSGNDQKDLTIPPIDVVVVRSRRYPMSKSR